MTDLDLPGLVRMVPWALLVMFALGSCVGVLGSWLMRHEGAKEINGHCGNCRDAIHRLAPENARLTAEVAALREERDTDAWHRGWQVAVRERDEARRTLADSEQECDRRRQWLDQLTVAEAALANVSGALCDSGVVVPAEVTQYGDAIRALTADRAAANAIAADLREEREAWWQERSRLRAALRRLSFTRSDGSICYDGARCQRADVGSLCGGIWQHSQQCEEARRALDDKTP